MEAKATLLVRSGNVIVGLGGAVRTNALLLLAETEIGGERSWSLRSTLKT